MTRVASLAKEKAAALYPFFDQWVKNKVASSGKSNHIDSGIPAEDVAHLIEKLISIRRPNARCAESNYGLSYPNYYKLLSISPPLGMQ